MKVIVTGSTGFVGKRLVANLIENGYIVAAVSRNSKIARAIFGNRVNVIGCDQPPVEFKLEVQGFGPELCIHLASYLTSEEGDETTQNLIESNIKFTATICEALRLTPLQFFINTGSFSEYYQGDGVLDPAYLYSATKTAARYLIEYFAKRCGYNVVHVVPYTIYGCGDTNKKAIDYIIEAVMCGRTVQMTEGFQVLDFIHVDDVVCFYLTLVKQIEVFNSGVEVFHIGTGRGTTLRELAEIIKKLCGKDTDSIEWGKRSYRERDMMHSIAPISKAWNKLHWRAKIDLETGIKNLLQNYGKDKERG